MTSEVAAQVDVLMIQLYRRSKGQFIQTLFASYDIADYWRHQLQPEYRVSNRAIIRITSQIWRIQRWLGFSVALRLCFALCWLVGMFLLIRRCFHLHFDSFSEQGDADAKILLLRTGVSNEPNIAAWLSTRHNEMPVKMLSLNDRAIFNLTSIRYLPALVSKYWSTSCELMQAILQLRADGYLDQKKSLILPPVWFFILARRAPLMCIYYTWASTFLAKSELSKLYFTMNSMLEGAFFAALPNLEHAYVEHGFPRRDIPPLSCSQYVYGNRYADYLRLFDSELDIHVIGNAYFPVGNVGAKERAIVVASLQDWPQWGIANVADTFNEALALAKIHGWRIIFRGRNYDEDAFAQGLQCEWNEISSPKQETFEECLHRVKPAMVWTTWSTAILDTQALGVKGVCFITDDLFSYFLPDFMAEESGDALIIDSNNVSKISLIEQLCAKEIKK